MAFMTVICLAIVAFTSQAETECGSEDQAVLLQNRMTMAMDEEANTTAVNARGDSSGDQDCPSGHAWSGRRRYGRYFASGDTKCPTGHGPEDPKKPGCCQKCSSGVPRNVYDWTSDDYSCKNGYVESTTEPGCCEACASKLSNYWHVEFGKTTRVQCPPGYLGGTNQCCEATDCRAVTCGSGYSNKGQGSKCDTDTCDKAFCCEIVCPTGQKPNAKGTACECESDGCPGGQYCAVDGACKARLVTLGPQCKPFCEPNDKQWAIKCKWKNCKGCGPC